jgi:hypothetical protein
MTYRKIRTFNDFEGYKWSTHTHSNVITCVPGSRELEITQADLRTKREQMINSAERTWLPFTVAVVKYALMANKFSVDEIRKHNHYRHYKMDARIIDRILGQDLYVYGENLDHRSLDLNTSVDNRIIMVKESDFIKELHLYEILVANKLDILSHKDTDLDVHLGRAVVYQPKDAYNMLEAVLKQSPHKNVLEHVVESLA